MQKAIAYYRVSTGKQKRSGLGLEAQQKTVKEYAAYNGYTLIEDFIETDSGARNGRVGLIAALQECKRQKAVLLIAALDRLSRSVAFIATLLESDVECKVVEYPNADNFTLHVLAAVAQKEREDISKRTTNALAAAKRRGVELGSFGRHVQSKKNRQKADQFASRLQPVIHAIRQRGIVTISGITKELNRMKIPTFHNGDNKWHRTTVHRLIKRL